MKPYRREAIEGERDTEGEDDTAALDSAGTGEYSTAEGGPSMHHGDHVHTLEETIDEEQPLLFHLHAGGREHEQQAAGATATRGRRASLTGTGSSSSSGIGGIRPVRSLSGAARTRCTSTSESRVREIIRDGEIVPIEETGQSSTPTLEDEWASTGTGRTLADPSRLQIAYRNLKRAYRYSTAASSLISVFLSR